MNHSDRANALAKPATQEKSRTDLARRAWIHLQRHLTRDSVRGKGIAGENASENSTQRRNL
jgi:hypothetical protein